MNASKSIIKIIYIIISLFVLQYASCDNHNNMYIVCLGMGYLPEPAAGAYELATYIPKLRELLPKCKGKAASRYM